MPSPTLYLIDTNILVHFVRASPLWHQIRDEFQPLLVTPTPIVSVVSHGELRSLAVQWTWGERKLQQVDFILGFFLVQTTLDPDVIDAYAVIDAHCDSAGLVLGQNDVWIAATAAVLEATLLTTDRDFLSLPPDFLTVKWIDPNTHPANGT